ncbi:ferritin-like domain-containing protein [Rhodococcus globerulus]|uniref:Ferritin-like domain-containing protein n=1 Tax=Rhodococcus globerulus TaxID=33008 RepID=A0ABU4BN12_RHOGO|nr:ferritin-like domain-containing protein [Rhodococcus globerulus]MDV6265622.1 ferritin-like domain-containing protein [Rhodococcus globerulus]QXW02689.1 ferritin-like domain-containing protein [Rhodococcus globerulus]
MSILRTSTTSDSAVLDAIESENAAIFAYGVVAAFSNPARANEVATHMATHRARRDALSVIAVDAGLTPPIAAAGYDIPFPVTDAITAAQLAAQIEADTAAAYRALIEQADSDDLRTFGVEALTDASIRGAGWNLALGTTPATSAFPGE